MSVTPTAESNRPRASTPLWIAYVAPIALFAALTAAEAYVASSAYIGFYLLKMAVVTALLIVLRAPRQDIRPTVRVLPAAILVGLVVFAEWILIDKYIPYPHLGRRTGLDPFIALPDPTLRALFLVARFYGLVLLVPVMEELFYRSFLLRWITRPDFAALPIGEFSGAAFAFVAVLFGLSHPEWLVAILCSCAYGLLLRRTRSLFACIVAHGVTNLALGVYILMFHDWKYW